MFFQIENTPERIRKERKPKTVLQTSPKDEIPRLTLAPFSRPPKVIFENVVVGTSCEKYLELFNPSKEIQEITLKATLPGLYVDLPQGCVALDPQSCYCITLVWTPLEVIALRETLRFTNEKRGRFDVIVVLKSILPGKNKIKGFKTSPGRIKKKTLKKSPGNISKKKVKVFNTTNEVTKVKIVQSTKLSSQCNITAYKSPENPFEANYDSNFTFNSSEVFANRIKPDNDFYLHRTYDKATLNNLEASTCMLKESNRQNTSATDLFDNLTFTPLKSVQSKTEKLEKGPNIVFSINSDSNYDSLETSDSNKENETHSIMCITSTHTNENRWLTVDNYTRLNQYIENETPKMIAKKVPQTSSPKDLNSPNFSINTDYSRISDLSFFPQRFSTERKPLSKLNYEISEDDQNIKIITDTYIKESPLENHINQVEARQPFSNKEPRFCKQALFKEQENRNNFERNHYRLDHNLWQHDVKSENRSPPRSITPPLQSIPEESIHLSDTQTFDKSTRDTETFSINRTYNKNDKSIMKQSLWSKKAVVKSKGPPSIRESFCTTNHTFVSNKSVQNISLGYIPNAYSQSLIINPFSSCTQFYDEALIKKFEKEFKRWLNYILTPPDLESNIEQKIDIGKVWIESRNTEVPTAPTKEKVCSSYHNSSRLESLRKSARTLLKSPEMCEVLRKLNAQIDKKLICIRDDRNLHLDVGLQKTIMEIILSYNPLWLRLGLEVIYNLVLPLKSNSDIEGITTFIVQRMFKNPFLKNKNAKSTAAPNILLPAYIEAIKKFTLKKFFSLVYFLDQAKQKKIISHDPCLFCRNAVCKESRQILIRFTRELIAGIGDITRHLRPTGYVVVHKQTYIDEYKYGVNDIAIDLRDGVRLTKVSEIILLKDNLIKQLRAPAISRLQKIHNVEVALKALRGENFEIEGEITATDIADGHREKTLSLLWQLIHVFRAPLFQKAANVIQIWWRKKYDVILEKRMIEEKELRRKHTAAGIIQFWWRQIQNKRRYEKRLYEVTRATITLQKFCRMWLCKTRLRRYKQSVLVIETWYRSMKLMQAAKQILREKKEERKLKSAIIIQTCFRRWICLKRYRSIVNGVVKIQTAFRRYSARKRYIQLRNYAIVIQSRFRNVLLTRKLLKRYAELKKATIIIQRQYRAQVAMKQSRKNYTELRNAVIAIQNRYRAQKLMKIERTRFELLKHSCVTIQRHLRAYRLGKETRSAFLTKRHAAILIQNWYRSQKARISFKRLKQAVIIVQRRYRAQILMKSERSKYNILKHSCTVIQTYFRAYRLGKATRKVFLEQRTAVIKIQNWYRTQHIRSEYKELKEAVITIQRRYRAQRKMHEERSKYLLLKKSCVAIQRFYRAYQLGKEIRTQYLKQTNAVLKIQDWYRSSKMSQKARHAFLCLKQAVIKIQHRFRAYRQMSIERTKFELVKRSCLTIQRYFRAFKLRVQVRSIYLEKRNAAMKIQAWYRSCKNGQRIKQEYNCTKRAIILIQRRYRAQKKMQLERARFESLKSSCITIQRYYRAYRLGKETQKWYMRQRSAAVKIQKWYRNCKKGQIALWEYQKTKKACITIQKIYRSYLITKRQRKEYLRIKMATVCVQKYYRCYKQAKIIRQCYVELKTTVIYVQRKFRALQAMKKARNQYLLEKKSASTIQRRFRALRSMRILRKEYLLKRTAAIVIQQKFRAYCLMRQQRKQFLIAKIACIRIQRFYRAVVTGRRERQKYLTVKNAAITMQTRFRALMQMRRERTAFIAKRKAAIIVQERYRAHKLMIQQKCVYKTTLEACVLIQRKYRAYILAKKERAKYLKLKYTIAALQKWYRSVLETRKRRQEYLILREKVIVLQSFFRMAIIRKQYHERREAILKIQRHYRLFLSMKTQRSRFLEMKSSITKIQAQVRGFLQKRKFQQIKAAVVLIQCAYRLKQTRQLILQNKRGKAALCIQKNTRRYLAQIKYERCRQKIIFIQRWWKALLLTKQMRNDYLRKRDAITKIQALSRGYLVRKQVESKKENLKKEREERRRNWAAARIQAFFRGVKVRKASNKYVTALRKRWREGKLVSTQRTLAERAEEALYILNSNMDIPAVLDAFTVLEQTTVLWPQKYAVKAGLLVHNVFGFMAATNRSLSSIEVLTRGATFLVNMTRYHITGPKLYQRDRVSAVLKYMWRFSTTEPNLFCRLATYLWLFAKYENTKKDLKEFLNEPDNHKMLLAIKNNIGRMKKMASNSMKYKLSTSQPSRKMSLPSRNTDRSSLNISVCSNVSMSCSVRNKNAITLPLLEPDYGIDRPGTLRYFEDPQQAIDCLFVTYDL
ncbi:unnamed protein product [Leptosia nina]|uniref:Calponin-homology (CH) domain-containing protein n=1 Tax=Leptosia nina TaxID=320188 RepID=A0AAV1JEZ0_9NEOP